MNSPIIQYIESKIDQNLDKIIDFFKINFQAYPPAIYNSMDLRHSGFKIAPIDTNCFPAGFNNVNGKYQEKANIEAKKYIEKFYQFENIKNIAIIGESHTRNLSYLSNLQNLQKIFSFEGKNTFICSLDQDREDQFELDHFDDKKILIHKITKKDNELFVNQNTKIDLAILNNDLTNYIPEIFENLSTIVTPPPKIGWHKRSKFNHFQIYNNLCEEISQIIEIDPWLISSYQAFLPEIDFKNRLGFEELAESTEKVLTQIQEKYNQYSIKQAPFCFIKADSGTYGMGITPVSSSLDIQNFNKKIRNKMNAIKDSKQNTSVIIQEGITTIDSVNNITAEPLIYMVNAKIVANLARTNQEKDQTSSLNSPGAVFYNLDEEKEINIGGEISSVKKAYWLVSTLASLATSIEMKNIN